MFLTGASHLGIPAVEGGSDDTAVAAAAFAAESSSVTLARADVLSAMTQTMPRRAESTGQVS